MALSLSSCGGKKEVYASKENVYTTEKVELPGGLDYTERLLYANERFYIIGGKSYSEGEGENAVYTSDTVMQVIDLSGNLVKENVISITDESSNSSRYIANMAVDNDGNLIALESSYEWNEETGESKEDYFIVKYDGDGNAVSEINLSKLKEAAMKQTGDDYFYVSSFLIADDGTVLIANENMIFAADESGGLKYTIKNENAGDNCWMSNPYKTGDGRIVTVVTTYQMNGAEYTSESKLYEIDLAAQKLGTEYPYSQNGTIMNGTDQYDLLISRDSGLVGYDIETQETEVIIDWLKSGIDTTAMDSSGTTVLPDGRILCVTYDYDYQGGGYSWSSDDQVINILTKVDPETLPDKKLIKLYAMYLDTGIKRQIVEFNKTNQEYEIELTSYSDYAVNSYDDAITKLNNDMISGNLPDIIILDSSMPIDSYISKGLLADLYEFIDKDETMNREDYLENVFKAYEVDGKLYELVPSFNINTIVGKTSLVGENPGWTMDEFISVVEANSEASVFGDEMTRDWFFSSVINACYGSFVNKETGECSFNSEEFVKILEFANRFPKEYNYDNIVYDDNYWNETESQYKEGRTLLNMYSMCNFTSIRELEKGSFGEEITFKGYPGAEGSGSSIAAYTEMAITSKAANPDGAWEFVKYFMSDEYQEEFEWEYPIKISALEKQMEAAKEKPYWIDENGEKVEYDNIIYIAGQEIKIGENTDEDNQKVLDLIKSATTVSRYDENIYNILEEEAAAYFEGQKSAEEVAEIIQNRVSNYIAENR